MAKLKLGSRMTCLIHLSIPYRNTNQFSPYCWNSCVESWLCSFFCVNQSISKDNPETFFSKGDGKLKFASKVKLKSMEFQCIMAFERSQVYSHAACAWGTSRGKPTVVCPKWCTTGQAFSKWWVLILLFIQQITGSYAQVTKRCAANQQRAITKIQVQRCAQLLVYTIHTDTCIYMSNHIIRIYIYRIILYICNNYIYIIIILYI